MSTPIFRASDKVVCIDDSPGKFTGLKLLEKGKVYVVDYTYVAVSGDLAVAIVGLTNGTLLFDGKRIGFDPKRFRHLHDIDGLVEKWTEESAKNWTE